MPMVSQYIAIYRIVVSVSDSFTKVVLFTDLQSGLVWSRWKFDLVGAQTKQGRATSDVTASQWLHDTFEISSKISYNL